MGTKIFAPHAAELTELCRRLEELAPTLDAARAWPARQLALCAQAGVYEWFVPRELGGQEWSEADILRGYLALGQACLTTTFVITQYMGACRRLAISENRPLAEALLPEWLAGRRLATVGISHLTTSRRHLAQPVLRAEQTAAGFVLDGYSPWVTGAPHAADVVLGATLDDGRQILVALPTDRPGVLIPPPAELVGLSASGTGPLECQRVEIERQRLLAGPVNDVMKQGVGANTGGLQTSTLAIGLARAAIDFLQAESRQRSDLATPAERLDEDWAILRDDLLAAADGLPACSPEELRARANSLALRATQAALTAAKGAGYVVGHPAGRWCREALFFLVWSCPQPVLAANLCELAGLQ